MLSARRRLARTAVLLLLGGCVLGGTVPAVIALAEQGWASWADVRPFLDGPDGAKGLDD